MLRHTIVAQSDDIQDRRLLAGSLHATPQRERHVRAGLLDPPRERIMVRFSNDIVIRRPANTVFAYLADLENLPRWNYAKLPLDVVDGRTRKLSTRASTATIMTSRKKMNPAIGVIQTILG
jgi:uncharacterized membrane protein